MDIQLIINEINEMKCKFLYDQNNFASALQIFSAIIHLSQLSICYENHIEYCLIMLSF